MWVPGYNMDNNGPVLFHEATHLWREQPHVPCPDDMWMTGTDVSGLAVCDETWAGPYGYEGGLIQLMFDNRELDQDDFQDRMIWSDLQTHFSKIQLLILED